MRQETIKTNKLTLDQLLDIDIDHLSDALQQYAAQIIVKELIKSDKVQEAKSSLLKEKKLNQLSQKIINEINNLREHN